MAVLLPTIDYTSRDYVAVRADMIRIIQARLRHWRADSDADFGVALVEAFAYACDVLHYYLDRVGTEAYLSTAVQRESLYSIASMFNYTPRSAQPSAVKLDFTNTTPNDIVLPAGTRCQASINTGSGTVLKNFELMAEYVIGGTPEISYEATVTKDIPATEGRTYSEETIGISSGYARQQYVLPRSSVISNSVSIITEMTNGVINEWVEVSDLADSYPGDRHFQTIRQTDNSTVVRFGNGARGSIPPQHSAIKATYRVGGGTLGNVSEHTITTVVEPILYGVSVTNPLAASGGQDAESLDSIRINAAKSFRARDRAVTLEDYEILVEALPYAAKAKAVGNSGSSVTVYACPIDDGTGKPAASADFLTDVRNHLLNRSMAGVSITVLGPAWVGIYIEMTAYCNASAYQTAVETEIRTRVAERYAFARRDFNGRVSAGDVLTAVAGTPGLDYAEVLDISSGTPDETKTTTAVTISTVNGIQEFSPSDHLKLTLVGGIGAS